MKIKLGSTLAYKDPQASSLYGIGVVMGVTDSEYTILWSLRGSKRYRRSILDKNLEDVFQKGQDRDDLPKERMLQLGATKSPVAFNENYDREKVKSLCEALKKSKAQNAKKVADSLAVDMLTGKLTLRPAIKTTLRQLAALCNTQKSGDAADVAQQISREFFFGYIIQDSDFKQLEADKSLTSS